jgi:hypothetical protein
MLKVAGFLTRHQTLAKILAVGLAALATAVLSISAAWKVYTAATRAAALANLAFGRSAATMAASAGSARLALIGKAGLVVAVGLLSYELTKAILKLTGLDQKLESLGGKAFDLAAKLGLAQGAPAAALSQGASGFIRRQARGLIAGGMTPAQAAARIAATHPGVQRGDIDVLAGVRGKIVVENRLYIDGQQVAAAVNRQNARGGRRTAHQTSGRRG